MNIFALLKNNNKGDSKIKRISISSDLQNKIGSYISESINFYNNSKKIKFSGEYKPDEDEVLYIENFTFNNDLNNPLNIENIEQNEIEYIKSLIFVSNTDYAFQVFDSRKIIKPEKFSLIYSKNTFSKIENKGIIIDPKIDALYLSTEKKLYFISFHNVSRIFDLSDYYREATDNEIKENIINNKSIFTIINENIDYNIFNSKLRKKIHLIIKNSVLKQVEEKFARVSNYAKELGLNFFDQDDKKIIFPEKKEDIEKLINFLNEDLFMSPISDSVYETNSKRRINLVNK